MTVSENHTPSGFDRRTVIRAAAWSAPVIALAAATPLAAASTTPQPAPGGGLSTWQGGTSVQTFTVSNPQRVQINQNQTVGFNVMDIDTGDNAPDGAYSSGALTVTVTWGAGNGVTAPGSYTLEERALNGWTRVGALPAPGTTGSVEYTYAGVLNGAANVVQLPVVWLLPTDSAVLVPSYVNTFLSGEYLSEKSSGAKVP